MLESVWPKFVPHNCFARHIKIIRGHGHHSETAVAYGSMMHHVVMNDDDFLRREVPSTILYRRLIRIGEKAYRPAAGPFFTCIDLRQPVVEALHPQPVHVDLGQFSMKISPRSGKKVNVTCANSRLI